MPVVAAGAAAASGGGGTAVRTVGTPAGPAPPTDTGTASPRRRISA